MTGISGVLKTRQPDGATAASKEWGVNSEYGVLRKVLSVIAGRSLMEATNPSGHRVYAQTWNGVQADL